MTDARQFSTPDGRTLQGYDATPDRIVPRLTVLWHHGTPGLGEVPPPLLADSAGRGIRWLGYDRPGYGGSSAVRDRDVASAAADVAAVADGFGVDRFAVLGSSGGGPHALACAALLGDRVVGAVSCSGLAPFGADGLDWYAGMYPGGEGELRAAAAGRAELTTYLQASDFDPAMFTPADHAALEGEWGWLGSCAGRALADGIGGMVEDDLAFVRAWGVDPADIDRPVLLMHGADDRIVPASHSEWLAAHVLGAELRVQQGHGHVSILAQAVDALDWLSSLPG